MKYVQTIKGSNVEIWIKNPIHADINAWIGAIERFKQIGIKNKKQFTEDFLIFMNQSIEIVQSGI